MTINTLHLNVIGVPKGQPRARACRRGPHVRMYDPGTADDWKSLIALELKRVIRGRRLPLFDGPVRVDLTLFFPRPKSHYRKAGLKPDAPVYCTAKPDRDNCDKAVLDIMTQCGVFRDDAVVVDGRITKLYATDPQLPGGRIHVVSLVDVEQANDSTAPTRRAAQDDE